MKAGLYARVSTDDQQSENQLIELREYARRRGFETVEFIEEPISGKYGEERRPKLHALMEAARSKKIDLVISWDLSRFARSIKQLVDSIENLRLWNVGFTTIRENIDTTSANGRLVFHIFAGLAEFERELIVERTKLGLRRAVAEGKKLGRPKLKVEPKTIQSFVLNLNPKPSFRALAAHFGVSKSWVAKALSIKPPSKILSLS